MARPQIPNPKIPQTAFAIPHYVMIQLRAMAAREKCTQRHLVLKALPFIGIHIEPEDLERDERKARPTETRRHYATKKAAPKDE